MHQRSTRLRALALAAAIPVAAVGAIALTAHAASSSPAAVVKAPATGMAGAATTAGGATAPATATGSTTATGTASPGPTMTPPSTSTQTPSAAPSGSASASSGASAGVSGRPVTVLNCLKHVVPVPVTVKIGQAGGREALVDADGCALYVNTQDTPQITACDQQCRAQFPPVPGPAQAGPGVAQTNLGTFTRPDGVVQATFFGHQLYYDAQDTQPGQANGQGVNRTWFLIDRNGTTLTS